jgi:hypothetical protein
MNFTRPRQAFVVLGVIFFSIPFVFFDPSSSVGQSDEKLVQREQLLCVLNNLPKYLAVRSNPVLIVLAMCPQAELSTEAIGKLTRDELPQPKVGKNDSNNIARFLVLSKADLNCLPKFRSTLNDNQGSIVRLPGNLCGS